MTTALEHAPPSTTDHPARLGGSVQPVPVDGGSLVVETIGTGPPLILLHGWTLDRRLWGPQIAPLARHHRLISYDRRGFGQSTAPPDLAREPADLRAIAAACGLTRFALLGMSQGARVALAFAARYPEQVAALALQGSPFPTPRTAEPDAEELPIAAMRRLARAGRLDELRQLWARHPLMQLHSATAAPLCAAMLADYTARDLIAPQTRLDVPSAALGRITMPALILTGAEETPARQTAAALLAERLHDHATRCTIPQAGHLANLDNPAAYNTALLDFLGRGEV